MKRRRRAYLRKLRRVLAGPHTAWPSLVERKNSAAPRPCGVFLIAPNKGRSQHG